MLVQSTLRPGQRGTKALVERYGDRLVCVRYRYDPRAGRRYKTVELIVDEGLWRPPDDRQPGEPVFVRVGYREEALRERVRRQEGDGIRAGSCGLWHTSRPSPSA